jgi:hypothetical protein
MTALSHWRYAIWAIMKAIVVVAVIKIVKHITFENDKKKSM